MFLFEREHDPFRRHFLVGYLGAVGGRDMLPYLVDEVLACDPDFLVRWRAARVVTGLCGRRTPDEAVELLTRFLIDADARAAAERAFPRLRGAMWRRTMDAVLRLPLKITVPPLLAALRPQGPEARELVPTLFRLLFPSVFLGPEPLLTSLQHQFLSTLVELSEAGEPAAVSPAPVSGLTWKTLFTPLRQAGLPTSREGVLEVLARSEG
jgi:hypothetical protein